MAYIGQSIKNGTFSVLDTSGNTYNGSNTAFNLGTQVGSPAQLLVSHDGVIQKPGTDYTLSSGGAAITFTTAPASGASIFIVEISGAVGGPMNTDINGAEFILDVDGDTSITADTDDQIDFKTGGSDRVTINSSGNVGIATTSPSFPLHVSGKIYGSGVVASAGNSFELSDNNVAIKRATDSMTLNTGGSARVTIDENGHVTMTSQSGFQAQNASEQSDLAINSFVTLTFATEISDTNADYDTSNSTFTAPVTGKYLVTASLQFNNLDHDATYWQTQIKTSNREYTKLDSGNQYDADPTNFGYYQTMVVDMDANDTCIIRWYQGGGTAQADMRTESFFAMQLLA
jgi:hypothetical protein